VAEAGAERVVHTGGGGRGERSLAGFGMRFGGDDMHGLEGMLVLMLLVSRLMDEAHHGCNAREVRR
jgi:hypothetical protein